MSLLAEIEARIDEIPSAEAGLAAELQKDLESIHEDLSKLSDDLKSNFHICPQVGQKLISEQTEKDYLDALAEDEELATKVKGKLEKLSVSLLDAESAIEIMPDFGSKMAALNKVEKIDRRRSLKNVCDKLKDLNEELLEWKKTARRGLEKIATSALPDALGIEQLIPGVVGRKSRKRSGPAPSPASSSRPVSSPRAPKSKPSNDPLPAIQPTQRSGDREKKRPARERTKSREGRNREADIAREHLDRITRWRPFNWSDLSRRVNFSRISEKSIKSLEIQALWADRRTNVVSVPYEGGPIDEKTPESLWDHPVTYPRQHESGKQKTFRVPGSDHIEAPDKGGRVLKYSMCETRFFAETYCDRQWEVELPESCLGVDDEKEIFACDVSYLDTPEKTLDDQGKCLEFVGLHFGPVAKKKVGRFVEAQINRKASDDREGRLLRVRFIIRVTPVWELRCEPRDLTRERGTWQFKVWLYGRDRKFYAKGIPRRFTLKAASWLAGCAAAGVPIGLFLMGFL